MDRAANPTGADGAIPRAHGSSARFPEGEPVSACAPDLLVRTDVSGRI